MNTTLSEQIEAVIDSLTLAHTQAVHVKQAMKKRRISFGLSYDHSDDDIAQMIGKLRYIKLMAVRREAAEAQSKANGASGAQPQLDGA